MLSNSGALQTPPQSSAATGLSLQHGCTDLLHIWRGKEKGPYFISENFRDCVKIFLEGFLQNSGATGALQCGLWDPVSCFGIL